MTNRICERSWQVVGGDAFKVVNSCVEKDGERIVTQGHHAYLREKKEDPAAALLWISCVCSVVGWMHWQLQAMKREVHEVFAPWRQRGVVTSFKPYAKHTRSQRICSRKFK